jgi:hypothetical protein
MLHYAKFHQALYPPTPAKEIYHKPGPGRGWPEECPPLRAANAFGFDLLANFALDFRYSQKTGQWKLMEPVVVESDFEWAADARSPGVKLEQEYAWFWQKGQTLPHRITDNVYEAIKHQVKVSTFLYLQTDPDEMLLIAEIPNLRRKFRAMSALIETDWYPASYPWHCVLELDPGAGKITIAKGEPLCRVIPVKRATYKAQAMDAKRFSAFFDRGQAWLEEHGRAHEEGAGSGTLDITRTYSRQQKKSTFETK